MFKGWFGKKKEEAPPPETKSEEAGIRPAEEPPAPLAAETPPSKERREAPAPEAPPKEKSRWSLFSRALDKTRKGLKSLFSLRRGIDEELLSEIETELYAADFGPEMVSELIDGEDGVRAAWKDRRIAEGADAREYLKEKLRGMLKRRDAALREPASPPLVILVAGVNGTGKTTSVAKLSKLLKDQGRRVVLAAGDTFRAAAVEQLTIWSQRLGVEIITGAAGADPASVAYRSADAALERGADVLIVDTAGRLHTQKNLMRELGKIRSVLAKKIPGAPHESLLVLDATTGQNALNQAKIFREEIEITGILLAKLDGTAKGGIVVAINNALEIPVKFIGIGESLEDLERFDVDRFVDALFES